MPVLFAVTLFTSATLLFMVQPMVGKMILPLLGGSPAAWNTCMVFFQGLLLLGYLYAHGVTGKYSGQTGRQAWLHLGVLGVTVGWLLLAAILSPDHSPVPVFQSLAPQGVAYPMFGVLALLAVAIGLPFLVVSTSAPLLQKWFSNTNHPSAADPYFLYAASNVGSLISLLGYPLFIEPNMHLADQAWFWAGGFVVLTGLIYLCGQAATHPLTAAVPTPQPSTPAGKAKTPPTPPKLEELPAGDRRRTIGKPPLSRKLRWLGLAFVPSSLMLGVTFHMTTDIASVPLLWVIPLALYLLTFIIAFSKTAQDREWYMPVLSNVSPVLTLLLVFVLTSSIPGLSTFFQLVLHLTTYFFLALLMHSELFLTRPEDTEYLTEYFLWISLGGVLGGIFNALLAPMIFPTDYEYAIALVVGCLLIPSSSTPEIPDAPPQSRLRNWAPYMFDVLVPLTMLALAAWLKVMQEYDWFRSAIDWTAATTNSGFKTVGLGVVLSGNTIQTLVVYAIPCMLCFLFIDRPVRFGLSVAAVLFLLSFWSAHSDNLVASERSFFGIMRVERYPEEINLIIYTEPSDPKNPESEKKLVRHSQRLDFHKLSHGTTLHGMQAAESATYPLFDDLPAVTPFAWGAVTMTAVKGGWDFRQEPLTYYHRSGPVGGIFHRHREIDPTADVAMVGLGTGSAAAYALPGQRLTFYEIDPTVIRLVWEPKTILNPEEVAKGQPPRKGPFTFVDDAKKRRAKVDYVLGDARLKLDEDKDRKYGLLLVDAFSSDSIPVHLLTKKAMQLYRDRLTEHGLLAIHISNRYIKLEPVVAALANDPDVNLVARVWNDDVEARYPGKTASSWVVLAKTEADLSDAITATASDERFGAIAGGWGYQVFNHKWRPLKLLKDVPVWTDDYTDVLRVMQLPEVQKIRKFFGQPTPIGTD